jgi:hypothetical protein
MQQLQQMANTMTKMQAQMRQERLERQQQPPLPPPPPPAPPRDKHREFMSHKPPTFSSSPDPLHADDWLKTVDKMLNIAQYTDREKVLNASGRLTSPATDGGTPTVLPMLLLPLLPGQIFLHNLGTIIFLLA